MFKLASDVKKCYPDILELILEDEQDLDYFLSYYSK